MGWEQDITNIKEYLHKLTGGDGIEVIHAGEAVEGEWVRVGVIEPAVFSILETENGNELIEAITFPEGMDIYGEFVKVQLVTGVVIAYKG